MNGISCFRIWSKKSEKRLPDEDIREKAYSLLAQGITAMVVCLEGSVGFSKGEERVKAVMG